MALPLGGPPLELSATPAWFRGRSFRRRVTRHKAGLVASQDGSPPRAQVHDDRRVDAKLKSDDPDGVREVVIWDTDEELTKGVARVELSDDRVVVEVAVESYASA